MDAFPPDSRRVYLHGTNEPRPPQGHHRAYATVVTHETPVSEPQSLTATLGRHYQAVGLQWRSNLCGSPRESVPPSRALQSYRNPAKRLRTSPRTYVIRVSWSLWLCIAACRDEAWDIQSSVHAATRHSDNDHHRRRRSRASQQRAHSIRHQLATPERVTREALAISPPPITTEQFSALVIVRSWLLCDLSYGTTARDLPTSPIRSR